ncbi:MAG: peptidoglycan-binding domain-containing protein, partial [bacterium]
KFNNITVACVMTLVLSGQAQPVLADNSIVGGIIGGIIGGAIMNEANRSRPQTSHRTATRTSGISSAQREANRETQVALNYFGFPVGTPDGALGPRSRSAISEYQVVLGYPATGDLADYQRDLLVTSYYRAQSGGSATAQAIASNAMGVRGLLITYRDERFGTAQVSPEVAGSTGGLPPEVAAAVNEIARNSDPTAEQLVQRSGFIQIADMNGDGRTDYLIDTSVTGSAFWCNAQSCAVRVFASTPEGYQRNDFQAFNAVPAMFSCQRGDCVKVDQGTALANATQPPATNMAAAPVPSAPAVVAAPQSVAPALPTFMDLAVTQVSLASACNKVSLQTNTNGGYTKVAAMSDPGFALAEQFCLARTYAMSQGEDLAARVPGVTPAQIAAQCQAFGPVLAPYVAALSVQSRDEVLTAVAAFVQSSGMATAQLTGTAKICLGVGYTTDKIEVAIGSALLLTALGEKAYAELVGHHLSQGFGATQRPDLALAWYEMGLDAAAGGTAVFAPGLPDRTALIRKAAYAVGGKADPSATGGAQVLPVFSLAPAAPANP